ncbi:MAG: 2Fe-2S iron-sulfur cluster binding domain-containing protein [Ideonella sp.]|jgi:2Fe-2S ferredoxin|nr:2Fe-2S iron-sulfur cluster binding domain-containing protein [Ideonella sp.]
MTITVHLVAPDGSRRSIGAKPGQSLMRAATNAGIEQIAADCGGCLTCATCHVIVDAAWSDRLGPAQGEENDLLDMTAVPRRPGSRLSCQIDLQDAFDGLVVHLPERQY